MHWGFHIVKIYNKQVVFFPFLMRRPKSPIYAFKTSCRKYALGFYCIKPYTYGFEYPDVPGIYLTYFIYYS